MPALTQVVVPLFSGTQPDGQQTSAFALWIAPSPNAIRRTARTVFIVRFVMALGRFGYDTTEAPPAVVAFQRRFRPRDWSGIIDAECRALLYGLLKQQG